MQVVDEIMTPGCPNCYIKHMTAALACMAMNRIGGAYVPYHAVTVARAYINLVEAKEGYESHRDLAIGMLAHAELLCCDEECADIRRIRTGLMTGDRDAETSLLMRVSPAALFVAHLREAARELPSVPPFEPYSTDGGCIEIHDVGQDTADAILTGIRSVRMEYFSEPAVGEETKREGGQDMATAKKACATKAACKGGAVKKAAQAACKGGKSKKGCK